MSLCRRCAVWALLPGVPPGGPSSGNRRRTPRAPALGGCCRAEQVDEIGEGTSMDRTVLCGKAARSCHTAAQVWSAGPRLGLPLSPDTLHA